MPYNNENSFIPYTMDQIWGIIIKYVNERTGDNYVYDSFVATNYYVGYYPLVQACLEMQEDINNIWGKLNDVFDTINKKILDPQITKDSLIQEFLNFKKDDELKPIKISVQQIINPSNDYENLKTILNNIVSNNGGALTIQQAEEMLKNLNNIKNSAGNMYCCIDTDDNYSTISKQEICNIFNLHTPFGLIYQGDQEENFNLSNGDIFAYRWTLPKTTNLWLKIDIKTARNNFEIPIDSIETIRSKLQANLDIHYKVGLDFTPEKYLEINKDIPFASEIKLYWSINEEVKEIEKIDNWSENIKLNNYNDKMLFDLTNRCLINIL